jgi:hypothetical protein
MSDYDSDLIRAAQREGILDNAGGHRRAPSLPREPDHLVTSHRYAPGLDAEYRPVCQFCTQPAKNHIGTPDDASS